MRRRVSVRIFAVPRSISAYVRSDRPAAWTEAGYENEAQMLINNLESLESAVISGNFDSQEQINQVYAEYLAEYNDLEAKARG